MRIKVARAGKVLGNQETIMTTFVIAREELFSNSIVVTVETLLCRSLRWGAFEVHKLNWFQGKSNKRLTVSGGEVFIGIQILFKFKEWGQGYLQVRQGGHVCKDALWEGGDVIAVQGPEDRRGCWCLIQRRDSSWREGCRACPSDVSVSAVRDMAPSPETSPAPLATGRGEEALNDPARPPCPSALLEDSVFAIILIYKRVARNLRV